MTAQSLPQRPAWKSLATHCHDLSSTHLRDLFDADPQRGTRFHVEAVDLYLDYSKNRVTDETMSLLRALADESQVAARRDAMFAGEHLNVSEDRAVLHVALRMPKDATLSVDGVDIVAEVHQVLERMAEFSSRVRSGQW